jgi:TPR repeat protein
MTPINPRDPWPPTQPVAPTVIATGITFFALLLFALLIQAFLGAVRSNHAPPVPGEDGLSYAERAFRQYDYDTAGKAFSDLAGKGNGVAQYWLGYMTELGLGIARDPRKAVALYEQAADRGVLAAELRLGEIFMRGDTLPPDFRRAKIYLDRAAYHGNARAALGLSEIFQHGLGVPANSVEAFAWAEVAALEGNVPARRERDAALRGLQPDDQHLASARAGEIMQQIARETTPGRTSDVGGQSTGRRQ